MEVYADILFMHDIMRVCSHPANVIVNVELFLMLCINVYFILYSHFVYYCFATKRKTDKHFQLSHIQIKTLFLFANAENLMVLRDFQERRKYWVTMSYMCLEILDTMLK